MCGVRERTYDDVGSRGYLAERLTAQRTESASHTIARHRITNLLAHDEATPGLAVGT